MKKQYIQPALMQVTLMTKKTYVINTSLPINNFAQDDVIGDVKEFNNWDNVTGDVNLWDDVW